ncbi:MAG: hypothetical protein J2P43_05935 [Candidatus Dormibacteraeota bacterium]|nr:hypothetical protein [Candidatus Dormibacteraeota bacterium]MBO0744538.1 hypothetical protein [Candidatus Dormibacteraeota bacterium]
MLLLALWLVVAALAVGGSGVVLLLLGQPEGLLLAILALLPLPLAVHQCVRARHLAAFRLGLFRDRLVVLADQKERQVPWTDIDTATLGDTSEWATMAWPKVRLTGRLTVRRADGSTLRFRPVEVGLAPVACRDLVLQLRDQESCRLRLPSYDPAIPLARHPVRSGEQLQPLL